MLVRHIRSVLHDAYGAIFREKVKNHKNVLDNLEPILVNMFNRLLVVNENIDIHKLKIIFIRTKSNISTDLESNQLT